MPKFTLPQAITAIFVILFLAGMGLYIYQRATIVIPPEPASGPTISLTGKLVPGGAECPLFEAQNGKTYALQVPGQLLADVKEGDTFYIKGTLQEISFCMQGEGTILLFEVSVPKVQMNSSGTTDRFCGGIAGFACPAGYDCKLTGSYPDAGGTCIPAAKKK